MKRIFLAVIAFFLITSFGVTSYGVSAALLIFTDKDAFLLAAGPTAYTEDFSTAPLGTVQSGETPQFGTLDFHYLGSPDGGLGDPFLGQPLIQDFGNINGSREFMGEVNADGSPSGIHYFGFPEPVFAFGGSFGGAVTGAFLTVTAAGQTVNLSSFLPNPGTGFFGLTSTEDFGIISFGTEKPTGSEVFRLDDVVYATRIETPVAPVPLPASFYFLLAAAGALLTLRSLSSTNQKRFAKRTSR